MAVRHRDWAAWGVQFHPESIASEYGATIVANFLLLTGGRCAASPAEPLVVSSPGSSPVDPSGDSGHGRDLHVRWLELSAVPDPVAAMTALFTTDEQAFWIDTLATDQHERPARYSYIGAAVSPASETVSYRIADGFVAVCRTGGPTTMVPGSTFDYLDGQLSQRSVEAISPVPLNLGYVGWLGYELRELVGAPHGRCSPHPDAFLALADRMLVIDHEASRAWLATLANADKRGSADAWIKAGKSALEGLRAAPPLQIPGAARMPLVSYRHDVAAYLDLIARCQEHIRAGESYELCLTNQLRVAAAVDPFILFRVLRHLSPAPFSAYFRAPGVAVVGASPERFLTVQDGVLHSKPMKGTRPRGADSATAHSLREELHASPKERAENLMIRRPRTQRLGFRRPAGFRFRRTVVRRRDVSPRAPDGFDRARFAEPPPHRCRRDTGDLPGRVQDRRTQAPFDGDTRRTRRRLPGHLFGRTRVHHPGSQDRPEHGDPYRDRDVA